METIFWLATFLLKVGRHGKFFCWAPIIQLTAMNIQQLVFAFTLCHSTAVIFLNQSFLFSFKIQSQNSAATTATTLFSTFPMEKWQLAIWVESTTTTPTTTTIKRILLFLLKPWIKLESHNNPDTMDIHHVPWFRLGDVYCPDAAQFIMAALIVTA